MVEECNQLAGDGLVEPFSKSPEILILEPFLGDSHKLLVDTLTQHVFSKTNVVSLPGKKFHWVMRTGSLLLASQIDVEKEYDVVVASASFNLAELLVQRPLLLNAFKVLYFHENQLEYPVQRGESSDYQFGFIQIISALAADKLIFNSCYNRDSFFSRVDAHINKIPISSRPRNIAAELQAKACAILPLPLLHIHIISSHSSINDDDDDSAMHPPQSGEGENSPLIILWNHRVEHDKGVESFCAVMEELLQTAPPHSFEAVLLGQRFSEVPDCWTALEQALSKREALRHSGYLASFPDYLRLLSQADVVVSTALHEFQGISLMEATALGAWPLAPQRLAYPEWLPPPHLYRTDKQLLKALRQCLRPERLAVLRKERATTAELAQSFRWAGASSAALWQAIFTGGSGP